MIALLSNGANCLCSLFWLKVHSHWEFWKKHPGLSAGARAPFGWPEWKNMHTYTRIWGVLVTRNALRTDNYLLGVSWDLHTLGSRSGMWNLIEHKQQASYDTIFIVDLNGSNPRRKWWSYDHELPWNTMDYHGSSWSYNHGKPWLTMFC